MLTVTLGSESAHSSSSGTMRMSADSIFYAVKPSKPGNLKNLAKEIVSVRNDLMGFLPEMRASVHASPKMQR